MQDPRAFEIDPDALSTSSVPADRFVYTPTYVAFDPFVEEPLAVLPAHQAEHLGRLIALMDEKKLTTSFTKKYADLDKIVEAAKRQLEEFEEEPPPLPPPGPRVIERARDEIVEIGEMLARGADVGDRVAIEAATERLSEVTKSVSSALKAAVVPAPTTTTGSTSTPMPPPGVAVPAEEQVAAVAQSEFGFLFLDRARIRPVGFALGEHLHSLSLAPGEEVTIEERTYSKRETSFEDATDQEKILDTEMSSTLTTELSEGLDRETSRTEADTNTMAMNVGGSIYGITFNVGPSSTSNLTEADRVTARQGVKNTQVSASKVAAKYRTQHKIVFKVSTESRFESTSKRTIRNPNVHTPIDLEYFKVMQRTRLSQERYGLRLCWAPAISDPGGKLFERIEAKRREIYAKVDKATSGPRPAPPSQPATGGGTTVAPRVVPESRVADKFDPVWGGQRHDYEVLIPAPPNMEWDRDEAGVRNSLVFAFTGTRPSNCSVSAVLPSGSGVKIIVHVGIEDCRNPLPDKWQFWEGQGSATFTVSARFQAAPVSTSNDAYNKALDDWRKAVEVWEAAERQAKADAKVAADEEWAAYMEHVALTTSPMHETVGAIVRNNFPSRYRDDIWEVDLFERIFDWKNASLRLYPSWWSNREMRDPDRSPYDFVNASFARLYLPIAPGAEQEALRWIYDRTLSSRAPAPVEKMISNVMKELDKYRKQNFGSEDELQLGTGGECPPSTERFICLAAWEELLPTDGTHIEVLQATTTAADDYSRLELDDANHLRNAQAEALRRENALREKAEKEGLGEIETEIKLNLGD